MRRFVVVMLCVLGLAGAACGGGSSTSTTGTSNPASRYPAQAQTARALYADADPATLQTLKGDPEDITAFLKAASELAAAEHIPVSQAIARLRDVQRLPPDVLRQLTSTWCFTHNEQGLTVVCKR